MRRVGTASCPGKWALRHAHQKSGLWPLTKQKELGLMEIDHGWGKAALAMKALARTNLES